MSVLHYGSNGMAECGAHGDRRVAEDSLTKEPERVTCGTCRGWLPLVVWPKQDRDVPTDVVLSLAALNQHARAYGCGKNAIYAYKTLCAGLLLVDGRASAQLVQWTGRCQHCSGTGRYVDSYGERWPHCRRCSSTGTVTLKFVETRLPTGAIWHHPFDMSNGWDLAKLANIATWTNDGWRDGNGNDPIFWHVTSNWTPNQPAEKLSADVAASHLNIVEAWVLRLAVGSVDTLHWLLERAKSEMRCYEITLGRAGEQCWYCESSDIHTALSRSGPPFSWSAPVCREHGNTPVALWPHKDALPEWMLTDALRAWKNRHMRLGFERDGSYLGW